MITNPFSSLADQEGFSAGLLNELALHNFGSFTKNDYEVLLFYLLLNDKNYSKLSNFDLSCKLRVTETKIRKLAYEASVKYGQNDTEDSLREKARKVLSKANYCEKDDCVKFAVEDRFLRDYIHSLLKKAYRYADELNNREVVSVPIKHFIFLVEKCNPESTPEIQIIVNEANKQLQMKGGTQLSWQGILSKFVEGAASEGGKVVVDTLVTLMTGGVSAIGQAVGLLNRILTHK